MSLNKLNNNFIGGVEISLTESIKALASLNIFEKAPMKENFVGRPFYVDYDTTLILISDYWKNEVGGIPQGYSTFSIL